LLTPAFPRFLALGDKALFGAVVHSLLKDGGTALVTMKSLTPEILEVADGAQSVSVGPKGTAEARFSVASKAVGMATILMTVKMAGEEDSFEMPLPVKLLSSPEVVAAYGSVPPEAQESVALPQGVVPNLGGLHLELSSTAMVGLGEGARYLVDYPYGCAEQRASCALALMLTSQLGGTFQLPGIQADDLKKVTQKTLRELEDFQCDNGGFVYWKGAPCHYASPFLTSYILHVYQRARELGYTVDADVLSRAADFLEQQVTSTGKPNEAYMPAYTAWQAFAVKVLAAEKRTVDSHLTRLYGYRDRMPVFGLCYLWDAMIAAGEKGARPEELKRRMKNAVLPEGGSAHVEELSDPYLLWFWNSTVRSSAIALGSLVRNADDPALVPGMVRWLMAARKEGRWGNTQENAMAMEALVDYYRKYEKDIPDFTAVAALGLKTLMTEPFKGRDSKAKMQDTPMADLLQAGKAGEKLPLTFKREGTGTLFYVARLKYASAELYQQGLDAGITVKRRYEPSAGGAALSSFKAGELIRVVLDFEFTKERRWVAVTDPIPAGLEPVESWFTTTARDLAGEQEETEEGGDWTEWWQKGGFDHVERHDDRVLLFATRLSEGHHTFSYVCRATTSGTFRTAPAHAEEMYEPEVFGRTATDVVEVKP
jgi:alpha-2-macroglobulin